MEIFTVKNIIIYFTLINLLTFFVMYVDKQRAKKGEWRIEEATLFKLVLLGGGIGGIIGMKKFRHKTRKTKFSMGFPIILGTQIALIVWFVFKQYC